VSPTLFCRVSDIRLVGGPTVTPAGGNDFHGTGFGFFPQSDFTAKDTFATIVPRKLASGRRQRGRKIIKDKLFYFFNYEAMRRGFPLIANITQAGIRCSTRPVSLTACAQPPRRPPVRYGHSLPRSAFSDVPRTTNQTWALARSTGVPPSAHSSAPA